MAIDLLGRYLATAPDDGRAWLQLGRFYLYDAREWHLHGHGGDPDGLLYLDFAATALEQAIRLSVDSGLVFRGLAEVERALIVVEDSGWEAGRFTRARSGSPVVPPYMLELGLNLLGSCPTGGVLLTGSDLETLSVWYGGIEHPSRDIIPIRPDLYATDSIYRRRMAEAMGIEPVLPVQRALALVAASRPLCLESRYRQRRRPRARLGAGPSGAREPAAGAAGRGADRHRAAQGHPPERLALGSGSARGVRPRRAAQPPPLQQPPPPLRRLAPAGMPPVAQAE
jgi:hypothetical protein